MKGYWLWVIDRWGESRGARGEGLGSRVKGRGSGGVSLESGVFIIFYICDKFFQTT